MPTLQPATQTSTQTELTIKGATIVVRESGSGLPMLLLHGSPDTGEMWLPLAVELGQTGRYIMPDLPGFGGSTLPPAFDLSLDNMADFVCELLGQLKVTEPVVLVMADFGGHYGLAFAVKYPNLVRGMVITNTNFFRDYQWHFFARLYRVPLIGDFLVHGSQKKMIHNAIKQAAPALPDEYITRSYATGFGSRKVQDTILRMYRARKSADFAGWDDKLIALLNEKPALVLWGDKDPFIDPKFGDRFGAAKVHHFKDYSHWLPLEIPDQYAAQIKAWLATV
jgi:pimeloyl-ACP methyl ester carboxylesterase